MIKRLITLALLGLIGILALGACGLLQEPEEASAPIEVIPLEADLLDEQAELVDSVSAKGEDETDVNADKAAGELVIFSIDPSRSEVRFQLDEDLRGQRNTVVGVTDQVAGELAINRSDLSTAQAGAILINARTLLTDNDLRNRVIQNRILDTGDHEFIIFEPKRIEGLPAAATIGESVSFSIVGDLTIRDIVQEAVFEVDATLTSEDEISGSALAVVTRADYDLNIPSVPRVANVEQDVEIYIDFVASR